jgi:broad specificity phosphatase PhoE
MNAGRVGWPQTLWLIRHGQSAGNVARDLAEAGGHTMIEIASRDVDVPLSSLGEEQSRSIGHWFGSLPVGRPPDVVLCSPYVRAQQTAELLLVSARLDRDRIEWVSDERLREKEFGILDRLTVRGIRELHPELSEQRAHVGKFYFRPPGGESWCDVILRLRSLLDTVRSAYHGRRVLIVAHQVTVTCLRYLLENLDEASLLALDRKADVPNCSVTSYECPSDDAGAAGPRLVLQNFVAPLVSLGTPVTAAPDVPAAPEA